MIETIQDAIITELEKIDGVKTVGVWQGDIDDLLKAPQRLPALHVIYQGADFEEKTVIGINRADHRMDFLIVLAARNLKSREAGASGAYTIIEAVRNYLIGRQISPYGWLWPVKEDLVMAEGGLLVYGLNYRLKTNIIATVPVPVPEP
jgi:phage gp37-like protein